MAESELPNLSDFIPEKARALLTGTGKDFINRIGEEAVKKVTAEVLCGENLRDQTEPLTRRRISQVCGALVAMFAKGWILQPDFTLRMSQIAANEMAAKRKLKTDGWPARWTLGLTDKLADNVLRGDASKLPKYITAFESALSDSATRCHEDCGPLTMQLSLPELGKSTSPLDWNEITRLTTALGCAALTIRGSEKSIYGKLFERLVLGSVLTILGFRFSRRSEVQTPSMVFWLSDSNDERESDATVIIAPGKVVRFDIGFIGSGNPEITKDKLSRYSRSMELNGKQAHSRTIVIVDRLPKKGSTERSAKAAGAEIVQMSHKYWPRELAMKLRSLEKGFQHPFTKMREAQIGPFIHQAIGRVNIEDFIGKLEITKLETPIDSDAGSQVNATIAIEGE